MPSEILILLIIAAAGIVGSIALMICNAVLGRRGAAQAAEEYEEPEDIDRAGISADAEGESARQVKFTPLDSEPETVSAQEAGDESLAEALERAVWPNEEGKELHLVRPEDGAERNSTMVGDIRVSIGNAQDIGQRGQQQDAFAITPLEEERVVNKFGVMAVVCDGMGGMENGAEAARAPLDAICRARTGAEILSAVQALQRAEDDLNTNVGVGAVVGWLAVRLR